MSLDEEYSAVYCRYSPEHEEEHDGSATESNLTRKGPFHRPGHIFVVFRTDICYFFFNLFSLSILSCFYFLS